MSNPNHDSKTGEFASAANATWARQFEDFATRNAFGMHTVNSGALRAHLHAHNDSVKTAAAKVVDAKKAVAVFEMADPRLGYVKTPDHVQQQLNDAKSNMRAVEKAARKTVGR